MKPSTIAAARKELVQLLLSLENEKEAAQFLDDLLTPNEYDTIAERWQLVKRLLEGKSQREIAEEFNLGIATVTRGNRCIKYGSGGFEMMWKKLQK